MVRRAPDRPAPVWSWAPYGAGIFGIGYVLCRGANAMRVWLPVKSDAKRESIHRSIFTQPDADPREGGRAAEVATRLKSLFLRGDDVSDIPIEFPQAPAFTATVLRRCHAISRGSTLSYAELARLSGNPGAVRAAARAMSTNPIPLLVPCHRVVPSTGGIGKYGGGTEMKRWLLQKEGMRAEG